MEKSSEYKLDLKGSVIMIIGTVIGAGIYIMIGPLAIATGPGLFLCYIIALVIAAASSICYAQVAAIYPSTAATYKYAKMFYGDFVGFMMGWLRVITAFFGLALMAKGFAQYLTVFWDLNGKVTAALVLSFFYVVNLMGIKTTQRVQGMLVVIVLLGLVSFSVFGIFRIKPENIFPVMQAGIGPILKGSITAFYAYTGLYIVAEIGDEIKEPQKNIPRSIFIASLIIGVLYLTAALVFSGGLGWEGIKAYRPNLAGAAKILFSPNIAALVQFSAIVAIITPLNAIYIAGSRFLYSLADDGVMPFVFTRLNRFNIPDAALTLNYVMALVTVMLDLPILFLGTISSIVLLSGMGLVAGVCLKLKKQHPDKLEDAAFRVPDKTIVFLSYLTLASAAVLTVVSCIEDTSILISLMVWVGIGSGYYLVRKRVYGKAFL